MKLAVSSPKSEVSGRLGPLCIACGNNHKFWVQTATGERLLELAELTQMDARIVGCGRCQTRRSIVVARVD